MITNLLDLITPVNLDEEKQKFFSSNTYNPVFHYLWQNESIVPTFSIKLKYPLWEAIRIQDHQVIVQSATNLFEVHHSDSRLPEARTLASMTGEKASGSAEEYAQMLRHGLNEFGLNDISVLIIEDAGFNARPHHAQKNITVSRHIHFDYFSMEAEVHHELVHVLRYHNGKFNNINRSQRFLPTEEGLASWCQDHTNNDNGLAQHAMEYVASDIGLRGSLRDIYNVLRDLGMDADLAWKRASRHKFGFVDTSRAGDILKPAMYFDNEMKIDKLTTDEKLRLFVGKIHQDELSDHPSYNGLWPAEQIIKYFHL